MMTKYIQTTTMLIIGLLAITSTSAQGVFDYVEGAYVMTNIKSMYGNGELGCEVIVYIDTKESDTNGDIKVQIGNAALPSVFLDSKIDFDNIENTQNLVSHKEKDGVYQLNFGKMRVSKDYSTRIAIEDGGEEAVTYDLPSIGFNHKITSM